ncbi:MAG: amino acid racemase [Synergistetes bacterium]|nr:amino acid racemase [Synergistota bacterium]MCX8127946.1 amino acid racemase [Synergistota bacterium]MDW8192013.1 amino acid racemase [Synergistota bacterium]
MNQGGNRSKIVGILGGMGPEATADLFLKIIRLTPALKDQDHIRVIIDSNPKIPDRTAYILGKGEDPFPALLETALNLKRAGVDFIIMPCNTAHYFLKRLEKETGLPFISIIDAALEELKERVSPPARVGILATDGTIRAGIYHESLKKEGFTPVVPSDERQKLVMKCIYEGVKAGRIAEAREWIKAPLGELQALGVKAIILGCTELPVLFDRTCHKEVLMIDATLALAKKVVSIAS